MKKLQCYSKIEDLPLTQDQNKKTETEKNVLLKIASV